MEAGSVHLSPSYPRFELVLNEDYFRIFVYNLRSLLVILYEKLSIMGDFHGLSGIGKIGGKRFARVFSNMA